MKRKNRKNHFLTAFAIICFFVCMALPVNVRALEQVNIEECLSTAYNTISIRFVLPSKCYTYEIYRSESYDSGYVLVDTASVYGTYGFGIDDDTYIFATSMDVIDCYYKKDEGEFILYDRTLSFNRTYYYKVKATYLSAESEFSNIVSATTKIGAANLLNCKQTSTSVVKLKWEKTSGAQGYYIYRKVSGGTWKKIKTIKKGSTVSYTDKSVKTGKKYFYRIRAYRKSGNKKLAGEYSLTYKIKVKK